MDTLSIISQLLDEKNISQQELCTFLGIGKQAFTNWKSGHTKSYKKYLPQIADFFGVSVDYLLGKEKKPSAESEELIKKLLEGNTNKAHYIMFGGAAPEVREIPPEAEAIIKSVLETFDKKNTD